MISQNSHAWVSIIYSLQTGGKIRPDEAFHLVEALDMFNTRS